MSPYVVGFILGAVCTGAAGWHAAKQHSKLTMARLAYKKTFKETR